MKGTYWYISVGKCIYIYDIYNKNMRELHFATIISIYTDMRSWYPTYRMKEAQGPNLFNAFPIKIQIRWKFRLALIQIQLGHHYNLLCVIIVFRGGAHYHFECERIGASKYHRWLSVTGYTFWRMGIGLERCVIVERDVLIWLREPQIRCIWQQLRHSIPFGRSSW